MCTEAETPVVQVQRYISRWQQKTTLAATYFGGLILINGKFHPLWANLFLGLYKNGKGDLDCDMHETNK